MGVGNQERRQLCQVEIERVRLGKVRLRGVEGGLAVEARHKVQVVGVVSAVVLGWAAARVVVVRASRPPEVAPGAAWVAAGVEHKRKVYSRMMRREANMPGGDRTGPAGMGPMTGRGAGFCAGYEVPGYANAGWGPAARFGAGRGRGFWGGRGGGGRGWRHGYCATGVPGWMRAPGSYAAVPTAEQEMEMLKGQAEHFEAALADIKKRIEELGAEKKNK